MSHLSKLFTRTPVDIPNRSGHDCSHQNFFTGRCGTLIPILLDELMPNETISLGFMANVQLPPMATNFYGLIDYRVEAFFVPMRLCWGGWEKFWTQPVSDPYLSATASIRPTQTPYVSLNQAGTQSIAFGPQSLSDYLGIKINSIAAASPFYIGNILPFIAYHRVFDDWYRNTLIQKELFSSFFNANSGSIGSAASISGVPYITANQIGDSFHTAGYNSVPNITFPDSVSLFSTRQRNWAKDYYTTAALYPSQAGGASLKFNVSSESGEFTISSLRAANVLQRWLERNNIAGFRYADQILAQYGCLPSDAIMNRPIFLGSAKFGVYNSSVIQTTSSSEESSNQNPFSGLGKKGGNSVGNGDASLIGSFTCKEHGYLLVFGSLVPHAYYSTGIRKLFQHCNQGDFAIPLLQGIGEQAIYTSELYYSSGSLSKNNLQQHVFGYTVEYAEYKYHDDEVHGYLVDGQNLSSFALQRSFEDKPDLSTSFIQIPQDFLSSVKSYSGQSNNFDYWANFYFSYKRINPLSEYIIPTLGDLKNTHRINVPFRGRQL